MCVGQGLPVKWVCNGLGLACTLMLVRMVADRADQADDAVSDCVEDLWNAHLTDPFLP